MHWLPGLALVPDAERAVFGGRSEKVLILWAVEGEASDTCSVLPEFVQLANAVPIGDIVKADHVVTAARQQPRPALVPLHAVGGVVCALTTPVYRISCHACLGFQVLPSEGFLLSRYAS